MAAARGARSSAAGARRARCRLTGERLQPRGRLGAIAVGGSRLRLCNQRENIRQRARVDLVVGRRQGHRQGWRRRQRGAHEEVRAETCACVCRAPRVTTHESRASCSRVATRVCASPRRASARHSRITLPPRMRVFACALAVCVSAQNGPQCVCERSFVAGHCQLVHILTRSPTPTPHTPAGSSSTRAHPPRPSFSNGRCRPTAPSCG